jgi:DNA-binding NarL/FixJ family response regulator
VSLLATTRFGYTASQTAFHANGSSSPQSEMGVSAEMKILIVDDHPLIREAVRHVLAQLDRDVQVFDADSCTSAAEQIAAHEDLDLVLLDLSLPGSSGLSALESLRDQFPTVPVVVLSARDDAGVVVGALDAGAMGFIPKTSSNELMISALRLVFSGGVYVPPQAISPVPHDDPAAPDPRSDALPPGMNPSEIGLTERQTEVLALMLQGKPNKLICRELNLAEGTVKIHVTAILKALGASNRTQAVIAASRMGLRVGNLMLS